MLFFSLKLFEKVKDTTPLSMLLTILFEVSESGTSSLSISRQASGHSAVISSRRDFAINLVREILLKVYKHVYFLVNVLARFRVHAWRVVLIKSCAYEVTYPNREGD